MHDTGSAAAPSTHRRRLLPAAQRPTSLLACTARSWRLASPPARCPSRATSPSSTPAPRRWPRGLAGAPPGPSAAWRSTPARVAPWALTWCTAPRPAHQSLLLVVPLVVLLVCRAVLIGNKTATTSELAVTGLRRGIDGYVGHEAWPHTDPYRADRWQGAIAWHQLLGWAQPWCQLVPVVLQLAGVASALLRPPAAASAAPVGGGKPACQARVGANHVSCTLCWGMAGASC
jgi:hypothetical protein